MRPRAGFRLFLTMIKLIVILTGLLSLAANNAWSGEVKTPVRFAIVGLVHDHARGFIPRTRGRQDLQLVGIVEPDQELAARYAGSFGLNTNLFFSSLEKLLDKTNVQAVATFTSTFDHRRVVEMCAPRGIHVMMEKPLAVNMEDARAMEAAARKGRIQVMVNYETTWYPGNQTAYSLVHEKHAIGDLRKIVVHDGHRGPKEIGCSSDFLKWLTNPVLNGGGALTDFGCYGADLITWLMQGQRPASVLAVTQHIKPDVYPNVEDEATIILTYPKTQGIIQASWNWPFDRKDMEIYGKTGSVLVPRSDFVRVRTGNDAESEKPAAPLTGALGDPLSYLAAVVRGEVRPSGLSSLEVNMTVTEILDVARLSARTGKRIDLPVIANDAHR
jgi:predicted dehydrogenase